MRVKNNKAPVNWMLRAAGVLLCLVLASSYLVCGLFARYTTSASGSDGARVARFEIEGGTISSAAITADLVPGESENCTLTITNKSEVAVEYEVSIVKQTNNLPLDFSVRLGENELKQEPDTFVFTDQLMPGELKNYSLDILWPAEQSSSIYSGMVDQFEVTVSATQVD